MVRDKKIENLLLYFKIGKIKLFPVHAEGLSNIFVEWFTTPAFPLCLSSSTSMPLTYVF